MTLDQALFVIVVAFWTGAAVGCFATDEAEIWPMAVMTTFGLLSVFFIMLVLAKGLGLR